MAPVHAQITFLENCRQNSRSDLHVFKKYYYTEIMGRGTITVMTFPWYWNCKLKKEKKIGLIPVLRLTYFSRKQLWQKSETLEGGTSSGIWLMESHRLNVEYLPSRLPFSRRWNRRNVSGILHGHGKDKQETSCVCM